MRVPTSDPHTINTCWSLFLLSTYLVVAEAASFDKKELCRSDTHTLGYGFKNLSKIYRPAYGFLFFVISISVQYPSFFDFSVQRSFQTCLLMLAGGANLPGVQHNSGQALLQAFHNYFNRQSQRKQQRPNPKSMTGIKSTME